MSAHRNIDKICIVVLVLMILLTVAFMNGEKLGITVIADEDAESYSGSSYFTENDHDGDWAENAYTTTITLEGSGGKIDGNGAYFLDGDLVISGGGWYVISGTLEDGGIVVDAHDSSKVWIRLNGVTVNCSDDACLRVDQADKVFLTLAEGTENSFTSGSTYSADALSDGTGGAVFAHDDLTINGSGSLTITAGYKHGIDANDSLVITGGTITITAPEDGIHVNDSFRFAEAALTLNAGDDGVHCDNELYVESGTILIESCTEGLEAVTIDIAGGDIAVYPSDDGLNANGGTGSMGFGGPGGTAQGRMTGQNGSASSEDSSSSEAEETYIRISGGTLKVINESGRDADGLDSNGSIYIDGGYVLISLSGDGSNCAIDCGTESGGECIVTGGIVLAFGGSSMAEAFSADSTQCAVLYNTGSTLQAGTLFRVLDADGEEVISYSPECSYSSVAFSTPALTVGETYTVVCGESSEELTPETASVSAGSAGGMGNMPFGGMQGGEMSGMNGTQSGDTEGTESGKSTEFGKMGQRRDGQMDSQLGDGSGTERPAPPDVESDTDRPTPPDGGNDTERPTPPDGGTGTAPQQSGESDSGFPGFSGNGQTAEEGTNSFSPEAAAAETAETESNGFTALNEFDSSVWVLLGASVLILAAAILFAKKYRKY